MYEAHGVTCSIGIGPTKLLAKLAAGMNKPAGIGELTDDDVRGRLRDLPVRDVWGIGPVAQQRLAALGLTTVGMLQDVPLPLLAAAFGRGAAGCASWPWGAASRRCAATGRCPSPWAARSPSPTTPTTSSSARHAAVAGRRAPRRAAAQGTRGPHGGREGALQHLSHRRPPPHAGRTGQQHRPRPRGRRGAVRRLGIGARWVRLVGVGVSDLTHGALQLTLDEGWREVALGEAVDRVRARYGFKALSLAGGAPRRRPPPPPVAGARLPPAAPPAAAGRSSSVPRVCAPCDGRAGPPGM